MKKASLLAFLLSLIFSVGVFGKSDAESLTKKKWYRVVTPNFTIVTDSKRRTAERLAENLEKFREAFQIFTGLELPVKSRRVKLVATKRDKTFDVLAVTDQLKRTGGFFRDSVNGNYSLVGLRSNKDLITLFHEYTHYLHSQLRMDDSPIWLREGLAQYFSTLEFEGDRDILYAKQLIGRLNFLSTQKWMPTEEVLSLKSISFKDRKKIHKFYSQSWLMVHYFWSSEELFRSFGIYIGLFNGGSSVEASVEQAFGISVSRLHRDLHDYATKHKHRYSKVSLKEPIKYEQIAIERLARDEAAFEVGEFLLQAQSSFDEAKEFFEYSLELNPSNVSSLTGLANIVMLDDIDLAESLIVKAKSLSSQDRWVSTIGGHIYGIKYKSASEEKEKLSYWNAAIGDYNIAINSADPSLEALTAAASLYALKEDWKKYDQMIGAAMQIAPSNQSVRYHAITANIKNGRKDSADFIADLVRTNSHMSAADLEKFEQWYKEIQAPDK